MVETGTGAHARSSKDMLVGIQALRFFAALLVVMFHTTLFIDSSGLKWLFRNGAIGVDVFFIISGFVMEHSYRSSMSPREFIWRRFLRIWPIYAVATLVFVGVFYPADWRKVPVSLAFLPLSNEPPYFGYAALGPGWTLNFEMLFYVMFAITCFFRRRFLILSAIIVGCVAIGAALAPIGGALNPYEARTMPIPSLGLLLSPMLVEFWIGMVLARIYKSNFRVTPRIAWIFLSFAVAFFLADLFLKVLPQRHGPLGFGLSALPLVFAAVFCWPDKPATTWLNRLCIQGGSMSYALYLFHLPMLEAARHLNNGVLVPWMFPALIVLAIAVAWVIHAALEKPLLDFLKGRPLRAATAS